MGYPKKNRYLLLAEFLFRTVNYEPIFFSMENLKSMKKRGSVIYRSDRKKELIRCLLYGFFQFGGPETSAGRAIWQSFDGRPEGKFLLAHENNSKQQRVSEKVERNPPCWKSLFGQN